MTWPPPGPLWRVRVRGPSMVPAIRSGDQLLVRRLRGGRSARPGAVVVVELPDGVVAVKRLIRREPDGRVWVEGDNPFGSTDSRTLGPLAASAVLGEAVLRLFPRPGRLKD